MTDLRTSTFPAPTGNDSSLCFARILIIINPMYCRWCAHQQYRFRPSNLRPFVGPFWLLESQPCAAPLHLATAHWPSLYISGWLSATNISSGPSRDQHRTRYTKAAAQYPYHSEHESFGMIGRDRPADIVQDRCR